MQLFRKKTLDRISHPKQLDDYIKVSNPGVWMILVVAILLVGGFLIWALFGTIEDNGITYNPIQLLFGSGK